MARQHAGMARPSGVRVFIKYPALFFWELVLGGLVWILIASSLVPLPLTQGWVMFVSVFCSVGTTVLLFWYMCGSDYEETSWVILDIVYHCFASMFYLSASILEALATNNMQEGSYFTYQHYLENIFATVFSCLATLVYMQHVCASCGILDYSLGEDSDSDN
ncbi:myelin and lymphocyte protein-like isoform X1 [Equus asinus]|uniref:myelin and lymphocyte protein-like isoform X1 n=1 Tax=Equus asinus TaxID=9793 RepID=UPI0038F67428